MILHLAFLWFVAINHYFLIFYVEGKPTITPDAKLFVNEYFNEGQPVNFVIQLFYLTSI